LHYGRYRRPLEGGAVIGGSAIRLVLRGIRPVRCEYIWLLKLVWHRPSFSHQGDMERGSNVGRLNFPDSRLIKNSDQLRPTRRCLGFAVNVTLDPSNRRQERKDRAVSRRGLPGRLRHQSNWFKDHLHTNRLLKFTSSCHRAGNTQWVPTCSEVAARRPEGRDQARDYRSPFCSPKIGLVVTCGRLKSLMGPAGLEPATRPL